MTKTCLIISGGDFSLPEDYPEISGSSRIADLIIACDKGYEYAERMGIRPDLIVGDFDSAGKPETDIPVEEFPSRKDYTDTMIAMMHAIDQGCDQVDIICALGGRMDHTYANIETLSYGAMHGAVCQILSEDTKVTVFASPEKETDPREIVLKKREGWSLSIFSVADQSNGICIHGAEYEVDDISMTNTLTLGQSNRITADQARVSVKDGMLIVIESKLKPGEHI